MAADYLVSGLQPLAIDGAAPCSKATFLALCREQLGPAPFAGLEKAWADLDSQMRNAAAEERARLRGKDAAEWRRPAQGCALHWQNRMRAAFAEKDPAARERLIDKVRWDAAGEMTPPASPLSRGAAFTYRIRLEIALKRQAITQDAGNTVLETILGTGSRPR